MAVFTKNQDVTLLQNWDHKGTVRIVDLVVYSCGRKQMVLVNAAGEKFEGRFFQPVEDQIMFSRVVPRLSPADAQAAARELGAAVVLAARARMQAAIASIGYGEDHGYTKAVRADIGQLHEPRAIVA